MPIFRSLPLAAVLFWGCQHAPERILVGHFEGYFSYHNERLTAIIDFNNDNEKQAALLSVPQNLQLQKPFDIVDYHDPDLTLTMDDVNGPVIIKAEIHNNNIDGKLNGSIPAAIHLSKSENYIPPVKKYIIEKINLDNKGINLPANLYLPKTGPPVGAVIMVAGSGHHIKEEYNGAADLFASRGIAVLTFDKRDVTTVPAGVHLKYINADIATMNELVSDIETAFYFLKTETRIRQNKIGLMGFSLGAVEVPVVTARHPDIAFIIAVSGNVTTDKEFIISQGLNKYRENHYIEQTLQQAENLYNRLFGFVENGLDKEAVQSELDKAYSEKWGQLCFPREVPNDDEIKYLLSWNNFRFDPRDYWKNINIPCLVAYGGEDKYIPVKKSIAILQDIFDLKKNLLTLKFYPGADHTIRTIPDKEHFSFPKYADGYIDDITNWLIQQTK